MKGENAAYRTFSTDRLQVRVYRNRIELGTAAGRHVAAAMKRMLDTQKRVRMVFAAAPSQNELLHDLASDKEIDWSRVVAFHMDEYIGLSPEVPQRFGQFLNQRLFGMVPGVTKREAVRQTLTGPIAEVCPVSILRTHPDCWLYLDTDSYGGEIIE